MSIAKLSFRKMHKRKFHATFLSGAHRMSGNALQRNGENTMTATGGDVDDLIYCVEWLPSDR